MKYMKPKMELQKLKLNTGISSLNDWLNTNSLTDAGITTYLINS